MNVQRAVLMATLKQEVMEAKGALSIKHIEKATQQKKVEVAEVHNLNQVIKSLQEQSAEV